MEDWNKLTEEQKQGIKDAIQQAEDGHTITHADLMKKYRIKYNI